jgi:serine/threonine protein kinase
MWSIGVITFILLGGYPPFHDKTMKGLFSKIRKAEFTFDPKYWSGVSEDAKDLISGLLTVDVNKRLTADQVLAHRWITRTDSMLASINLSESLEEFKKFHATRKLKGAVRTVMMINRLNRMMGVTRQSSADSYNAHVSQPIEITSDDGMSEKASMEVDEVKVVVSE